MATTREYIAAENSAQIMTMEKSGSSSGSRNLPQEEILDYINRYPIILQGCDVKEPLDVTAKPHPMLQCDFLGPATVDITAEIRDGDCNTFVTPAGGDYETDGTVTAVHVLAGDGEAYGEEDVYQRTYCARMDVLFDEDGSGGQLESVKHHKFNVTLKFNNTGFGSGEGIRASTSHLSISGFGDGSGGNWTDKITFPTVLLTGLVVVVGMVFMVVFTNRPKREDVSRKYVEHINDDEIEDTVGDTVYV